MSPNIGSSAYASAFENLPAPDTAMLRGKTLEYLESFDKQKWYDKPITSILKGEKFPISGKETLKATVDAFGKENGRQQFATAEQVEQIAQHVATYQSPYKDLRAELRQIESKLLTDYSGELIGNQCLDFCKQDGVTEMEEATMANHVERNLNDMLLKDEADGKVDISRRVMYISCVSNFTLFLDLFRKTIRSLELGIPCVVLGRSNTSQHAFRWTELLMDLMKQEGIQDLGILTFFSASLDDIKSVTRNQKDSTGNLYATCSRTLAADMISGYPNTVASTGGPNTLLTTHWTDGVKEAIRMSATIESSGQCTALRHCVVPNVNVEDAMSVFNSTQTITDPSVAVKESMFDGVFAKHKGTPEPPSDEYEHVKSADAFLRVTEDLPDEIEEYWRKVALDFTDLGKGWEYDDGNIYDIAGWLNRNQPITLAVNSRREKALVLAKKMFEKTGLVVYTVGSIDDNAMPPALSCQARPQEAEIFGELPPRSIMQEYTRYPVFVPSSTPSYDSSYTAWYLEKETKLENPDEVPPFIHDLLTEIQNPAVRGYCIELMNYLMDACENNPKQGFGTSRTALWGLQRPPHKIGYVSIVRCGKSVSIDAMAPIFVLFWATNASDLVELSIHPENSKIRQFIKGHYVKILLQSNSDFAKHVKSARKYDNMFNLVEPTTVMTSFPLVGQFVSLYVPFGHIKSTMPNDFGFVHTLSKSEKWLKIRKGSLTVPTSSKKAAGKK